ncbi:MAG TPA: hypothetical protein PKC18_02670 [Lacipirellulaceae bacterium]|nr:hypothetical protein [Lacipirellulaceae bacterium]HMP05927.1 hypothetical protein [Lacipirellulaceae bacterium]
MRSVPEATLVAIQERFHAVIRERAAELTEQQMLDLPELAPLLSSNDPKAWFSVPGMYGGFSYWFEGEGETAKLVTESWSRIVDGSGQRHEITAQGSQLVDQGFV